MKKETTHKLTPPGIAEIIFDSAYLVFVICAGIFMICSAQGGNQPRLYYGIMAVTLGAGDSFHLIPRIMGHLKGMEHYTKELGAGKWVTSITMTVFYLLLYYIWTIHYNRPLWTPVAIILFLLAGIRILLCMFPQNKWMSEDAPVTWAVYRNIPFALIGIIVLFLYMGKTDMFQFMPLVVFLSFLFYVPVVLWSKTHPKTGMLMLPKTVAYIWIVCMGMSL